VAERRGGWGGRRDHRRIAGRWINAGGGGGAPTWGSGIAGVPTTGWTYKAVGAAQRQGWRDATSKDREELA
jgi:hypothetical protein